MEFKRVESAIDYFIQELTYDVEVRGKDINTEMWCYLRNQNVFVDYRYRPNKTLKYFHNCIEKKTTLKAVLLSFLYLKYKNNLTAYITVNRLALGIDKYLVAEALGAHYHSIRGYFYGTQPKTKDRLDKLMEYFKVTNEDMQRDICFFKVAI